MEEAALGDQENLLAVHAALAKCSAHVALAGLIAVVDGQIEHVDAALDGAQGGASVAQAGLLADLAQVRAHAEAGKLQSAGLAVEARCVVRGLREAAGALGRGLTGEALLGGHGPL